MATAVPLLQNQLDDESFSFKTNAGAEPVSTFIAMGLDENLLRGIYNYGFEKPSAIQQKAILPIISGRNVIAQAQHSTGRSLAIAISVCQLIDAKVAGVQAIILSPTKELAAQLEKVISAIGKYKHVHASALIGEKSSVEGMRNVHVVLGTPGSVNDMLLSKKSMSNRRIEVLIFDDVDEMLSRGFKDRIYSVYSNLPQKLQVVLICATLPHEVFNMKNQMMTDPVSILRKGDGFTLEGIKQFFVEVEKEEFKFETLCDLYGTLTISQSVIFCNTKSKVNWLTEKMRTDNFTVSSMHGDMPQKECDAILTVFRSLATRVLITTDVWAGGIAVQQASHVINYDLPSEHGLYICRIGRLKTNSQGAAINFVRKDDFDILRGLQHYYSTQIDKMPTNVADDLI